MLRWWLVGFLLFGLTAGCGGESVSPPESSPSVTPVVTPSPTVVKPGPPELPERARSNTKAGAEAFLRHYIDLVNHAQATGETGALAAVDEAGCESCSSAIAAVKALYREGGSARGGTWQLRISSSTYIDLVDGWVFATVVSYGEQTLSYIDGRRDTINLAGSVRTRFSVTRRGGKWKMTSWTRYR